MRITCQRGVTLLECVAALAMSALVLAGVAVALEVGLSTFKSQQANDTPQQRAKVVMERIVWAMETARRWEKSNLPPQTDSTKTGSWLDRTDPATGKNLTLEYKWDDTSYILREKDAYSGLDYGILTNVTHFAATSPGTTGAAVVTISLTVGHPPDAVTLTETRRLGGPW